MDVAVARREGERTERRRRRQAIMSGFAAAAVVALVLAVAAWVARGDAEDNAALAEENAAAAAEREQEALAAQLLADRNAASAEEEAQRADIEARRAEQNALANEGRALSAEADRITPLDPELGLLLGLESAARYQQGGLEVPIATQTSLRNALREGRIVARFDGGLFAPVSEDGQLVATARPDGGMAVWDLATSEAVGEWTFPARAMGAAFVPGTGEVVVRVDGDRDPVFVVDLVSGDARPLLAPDAERLGDGSINTTFGPLAIVVDPAGELVAYPTEIGLELRDLATGSLIFSEEDAIEPWFADDGRLWFTVPDFQAGSGDVFVLEQGADVASPFASVDFDAAFAVPSPDGSKVALASQLGIVAVVDAISGEELSRAATDRAFRPIWIGENRLVTGGEAVLRVLDAETGVVLFELLGHRGGSWDYEVIPGTSLLVSGGLADGQTLVFDVTDVGLSEVGAWSHLSEGVVDVRYTPDGERVVATGWNSFLSASRDGSVSLSVEGAERVPPGLSFASADGQLVALREEDSTWTLRETEAGAVVFRGEPDWLIQSISADNSVVTVLRQEGCVFKAVDIRVGCRSVDRRATIL